MLSHFFLLFPYFLHLLHYKRSIYSLLVSVHDGGWKKNIEVELSGIFVIANFCFLLFWVVLIISIFVLKNSHFICFCIYHLKKLKYSCFIVLFLLSSSVDQPYVYISPLSWASLSPPPHSTPLGHHRAPCKASSSISSSPLAILHIVVYICQFCFPSLSHPCLPPLCPHFHSLCLCLYFCLASGFICTFFLIFHIYVLIYGICFFLYDLNEWMWKSLSCV